MPLQSERQRPTVSWRLIVASDVNNLQGDSNEKSLSWRNAAATRMGTARGEALSEVYCAVCHGEKGAGEPAPVALKDAAQGVDDAALASFITESLPGTAMPGFGKTLTAEQIETDRRLLE